MWNRVELITCPAPTASAIPAAWGWCRRCPVPFYTRSIAVPVKTRASHIRDPRETDITHARRRLRNLRRGSRARARDYTRVNPTAPSPHREEFISEMIVVAARRRRRRRRNSDSSDNGNDTNCTRSRTSGMKRVAPVWPTRHTKCRRMPSVTERRRARPSQGSHFEVSSAVNLNAIKYEKKEIHRYSIQ